MNAIPTIVCYPNLLPFEPTKENINQFVATLAGAGVTHIQVNHLPDLMHPEQLNQPDNVYLWFANFAPALDMFVSSDLNRGLYPEMYLERNRRLLLRFVEAAKKHGVAPLLYLCEPRFVPERFFQKHPTLRGPRVDNPTCSRTPLFALCTDMPPVRDHYRQMMSKMMAMIPELSMATLFTSDSASGFDYNPEVYAGANGAGFNQRFPLEKRVSRFLTLLCEEGRKKNPQFTMNLTSGFNLSTRTKILELCPEGVVGSVNGIYDWEGGLEEQWGYHQAVWGIPKAKWNLKNLDRAAAAKDRYDDMKSRFDVAAKGGKSPIVHCELPTTDYPRPLRYIPEPFEVIRIMKQIASMGAKKIAAWGVINSPQQVPWDVNMQAMKAINADIHADADAIVLKIAKDWVGEKFAPTLLEAWRECDHAWCHRPMWSHFGLNKQAMPGPMVPDIPALFPEEIAYYRTVVMDDLEAIQGLGSFIRHESDERMRDFVIDDLYNKQTLAQLANVIAKLAAAEATASAQAKAVFKDQREYVEYAMLYQRSHRNWYEAGRHLAAGENPKLDRSMRQIIDDEIQTTQSMIALLEGRQEHFMRTMQSDQMTYEFGPGFTDHLKERVKVMLKHRDDKPRDLSDFQGKMRSYLIDMER